MIITALVFIGQERICMQHIADIIAPSITDSDAVPLRIRIRQVLSYFDNIQFPFAMIMSEARMMDGLPDYDYASLVPDWEAVKNGTWKGTNWLDESRNKNAPIQNHALNITGGTEQSVYSIGLAYTNQEGIIGAPAQPKYIRYTARDRKSTRLNSSH